MGHLLVHVPVSVLSFFSIDSPHSYVRQMLICNLHSDLDITSCMPCVDLHPANPSTDLNLIICHDRMSVMYLTPSEGQYTWVSFLTVFIIVWVVVFALSYFDTTYLYIDPWGRVYRPLAGPIILSTIIAFLIAFCCYAAGGGIRNPKDLMDGITWEHI